MGLSKQMGYYRFAGRSLWDLSWIKDHVQLVAEPRRQFSWRALDFGRQVSLTTAADAVGLGAVLPATTITEGAKEPLEQLQVKTPGPVTEDHFGPSVVVILSVTRVSTNVDILEILIFFLKNVK